MTRINGRTAAGKLAAAQRTIKEIEKNVDDMRKTMIRIGEKSRLGWSDPRITEIEREIDFWVGRNIENREQLPRIRAEVAAAAQIKGRYQGQEMTPVMKARAARAQARRAERLAAQQAAS